MKMSKSPRAAAAGIAVNALCTFIYAFMVVGTLVVFNQDSGTETLTPCLMDCSTDMPDPKVAITVGELEAGGLSCSENSTLTDTIVFEDYSGEVTVVGFDDAFAKSKAGDGWVRSFCA